jgi:hypothetical protein
VFIDKQDVVLEAGVQVGLETEMYHNRVVVTVDVCVDSVQTLEDLAEETGEGLGEGDTCRCDQVSDGSQNTPATLGIFTDATGKHLLIVDIALYPTHEVLNVFGGRHLGWPLEVLRVLPKVLEPERMVSLDRGQGVLR